jgi:hypothetical protein
MFVYVGCLMGTSGYTVQQGCTLRQFCICGSANQKYPYFVALFGFKMINTVVLAPILFEVAAQIKK